MVEQNNNILYSILESFNNPKDPTTEGRICYSRSLFNINHINLDNPLHLDNSLKDKKIGHFIFEKKIGQGTFGKVILARDEITGEKVAIKILEKEKILKQTSLNKLEREINILKLLRHDNIVYLYNVIDTKDYLYLVMEYIKGIELFDYINMKHYINERESCRFFQQIISGIEYLGKIKVVHRDIKPENLLISDNGTIKIVDFGLSNTYFNDNLLLTACGSPCYAAPEMVKGEEYSGISVDLWSSGVVLYAMLCGALPFEDKDNDKLYDKIAEGKFDVPNFLSKDAVNFLHGILNVDPNKRFNIQQIKKHPWFNQINPRINMSEGLLIKNVIVPIDDNIISIMVDKYMFKEEEIKIDLILNKFNQTTTVYYLLLRKKIREGKKTIGDMKSNIFEKYINDEKNQLSYYYNDYNLVIKDRVYGIKFERKKNEGKKIRQISETKNIKKRYLINFDLLKNKKENHNRTNRGNSFIINNYKKLKFNFHNEKSPTYINCSSKKKMNKLNEAINLKIWKDIYIKKLAKIRKKNSRKSNNLTTSFFKKKNKIIFNNNNNTNNFKLKIIKKLPFHLTNNFNSSIDSYINTKENNNKTINTIIDNNHIINTSKENIENISTNNELKFSFNKKLLSIKKQLNIKNRINNEIRNSFNNNTTLFHKNKANTINAKSTIDNYQTYNSKFTPLNYSINKLVNNRNNRMKLMNNKNLKINNNKNLKTAQLKIKVDKKNKDSNSSIISCLNGRFLRQQNSIKNVLFSENNTKENIFKNSDFIYKRINRKKDKNDSISNNSFKIINIDRITGNDSLFGGFDQKKEIKPINKKEAYKKIKLQKSPFNTQQKPNIYDKKYIVKKSILRNKNPTEVQELQDFAKSLLDGNNDKNNITSVTYGSNTFTDIHTINDYSKGLLKIRGNNLTKNNSKQKLNKQYNFSNINVTEDFSVIDNQCNTQKDNSNIYINDINTTQPKNKFIKYFRKKITKKRILLDNVSINQSNNKNIRRTINKSNIISFYNTLNITDNNNSSDNKYINNYKDKNEPNKKEKIKDENKNKKQKNNLNKIFNQPQLCITNINFYNYVNDTQKNTIPNDNLISYTYANPNKKITKIVSSNNQYNIKKENDYNINYTPFDLNSIIAINKLKNIKFSIIKELNLRKINYKICHNNNNSNLILKFNCYRNEMRFDLNVFIYQENSESKIYVINAIRKKGNKNTIKCKHLINKLINKIE